MYNFDEIKNILEKSLDTECSYGLNDTIAELSEARRQLIENMTVYTDMLALFDARIEQIVKRRDEAEAYVNQE